MLRRLALLTAVPAMLVSAFQWTNQKKDKRRDTSVRNVQGVVSLPGGSPADGAVVQLKNLKTLQVRSYITQSEGKFQFQNLSRTTDYEVSAAFHDMVSQKRTLSVFDTRLDAVVNLKLEAKKEQSRSHAQEERNR